MGFFDRFFKKETNSKLDADSKLEWGKIEQENRVNWEKEQKILEKERELREREKSPIKSSKSTEEKVIKPKQKQMSGDEILRNRPNKPSVETLMKTTPLSGQGGTIVIECFSCGQKTCSGRLIPGSPIVELQCSTCGWSGSIPVNIK